MNTLKFIVVVSMVLLSTVVYHQVVHGQTLEELQNQVRLPELETLLNYCYQNADRPNPLQDLIDNGFLSPSFKGETCISVKQKYDDVETRLSRQLANLSQERAEMTERNSRYIECARNESTTFEECNRIREGIK